MSRKSETTTTWPRRAAQAARAARARRRGRRRVRASRRRRGVSCTRDSAASTRGRDAAGRSRTSSRPPATTTCRPGCRPAAEEPERGHGGRARRRASPASVGAEVEAGRAVDHQPGLQLAVGVGRAHLRVERTGRDVPVDAAGFVARAVGPGPGGLADPGPGAAQELAGQQAVEAAGDVQLEAAQQRRLVGDGRRGHGGHASTLRSPASALGHADTLDGSAPGAAASRRRPAAARRGARHSRQEPTDDRRRWSRPRPARRS